MRLSATLHLPALALLVLLIWPVQAGARQVSTTASLRARPVKLSSVRGRLRLLRCGARRAYKRMAGSFEYQTRSMCGPTSLANVLNAGERGRASHTQFSVLRRSGKSLALVRGEAPRPDGTIPPRGFTLQELHGVLRRYRPDAAIRPVRSDASPARIKAELAGALAGSGLVVVNFDRRALGQQGRGHFAPLGAYDARSDSFLVMDVNRKRGWTWIDADALIAAMGQKTVESRGYLVTGAGRPR